MSTDCLSDIAEALENGRLELVAEDSTAQVVEQRVHEGVTVRLDLLAERACDIRHKSYSD